MIHFAFGWTVLVGMSIAGLCLGLLMVGLFVDAIRKQEWGLVVFMLAVLVSGFAYLGWWLTK